MMGVGVSTACHATGAADIAAAAQLACLLEASAPKPGNVSPGHHFADARYEDFLASATAIGEPLRTAATRSLGATIRLAIDTTGHWTRSNTNLGIVLLLAPLVHAAIQVSQSMAAHRTTQEPSWAVLRRALRRVLETTTVDDARDVYAAIRRAAPGGLGRVKAQDVADEPTITLLDVMRLAADRDGIAREYTTAFEVTFERGAPALAAARRDGLPWDDAVVETFLVLLASGPDSHVARRAGAAAAAEVSQWAAGALAAGGIRCPAGRLAIGEMDRKLRDARNTTNPGTAADLTTAAIFVVLLSGGWHSTQGGCGGEPR